MLRALETRPQDIKVKRDVTYPDEVLHKKEAKRLIKKVNDKGPKSWLKTLTE